MRQRSATARRRMATSPPLFWTELDSVRQQVDQYLGEPVMIAGDDDFPITQVFVQGGALVVEQLAGGVDGVLDQAA